MARRERQKTVTQTRGGKMDESQPIEKSDKCDAGTVDGGRDDAAYVIDGICGTPMPRL